jgi:tetratricopeptide (TPR) repeat protein/Zn-dependent membrane protease YugP
MFLTDLEGGYYWILVLGAGLAAILVSRAKHHLQRTFCHFGATSAACGLTGALAARRLLNAVGLAPVAVVRSNWLDCYHPYKRQVQLRDPTFDGSTLASLAIAAHEVGHAQQFAGGFWPARLRLWMRPVYYGLLLAMLGLLVLCFTCGAGSWAVFVVVGGTLIVFLVQIPTVVPLEYDASRRAKGLVAKEGLVAPYEESSFDRLLKAASRTYLARECQRWILLCAGAAVIFWTAPILSADRSKEFAAMERPVGSWSRLGAWPPDDALIAAERPDQQTAPFADLAYVLLSSLGTLIPAGLAVFLLAKFAKPSRQRPTSCETAVARNNAGLNLFQRGEYAAAVEAFTSALQLDPKLHAASFNRGHCHLRQGRLDQAMADFEASLLLHPHFVDALALRAQIWTQRAKYDRALADLNQALEMAPKNALAITCRANLCLVQGDYVGAMADFDRAIANAPEYGSAYLGRAKIELARGKTDAALADCCQAFAFGADTGDAYSLRSHIWLEKRDYDRAIADLTACLKSLPQQALVFCNRGLAHYLKGDYPRALADLDKALELDPKEAFAYNNRGAASLKMGNFAAARVDFQKAIDLKPDFPNPHRHLAWLQATCPLPEFRDGTSAVAHAQRALELARENPGEYQAVLAAAYAEAGDFSRAVECQSRCLEASPPESLAPMRERLKLYESQQPFRDRAADCCVVSGSQADAP